MLLASLAAGCTGRGSGAGAPPPGPSAAQVRFREVGLSAGLRYEWGNGGKSPLTNLETFGAGCAFLDFDQDARLDVLCVGKKGCRLFRGDGAGQFADATRQVGLDRIRGYWIGCGVGDADGDGWPDLYLTGYHCSAFLRNDGGRRVVDVTAASGARDPLWGSSAGFADLDGDGDLDLYVGNYVIFGPKEPQFCEMAPGLKSGCPPRSYRPEFGMLFENLGGGKFRNITAPSGVKAGHGKALALGFRDYDNDGKTDFYVANDGLPGELWHNEGGLKFTDRAIELGCAFGPEGMPQAGMGVDWADVDRNGWLDLAVTAFSGEPYSLYLFDGKTFDNATYALGIGKRTRDLLGFGVRFLDFENDGWPDVIYANGHVYDNVHKVMAGATYPQKLKLFRNTGGKFHDLGDGGLPEPIVGRGLASGDYDADGRMDFLAVDFEGRVRLYHNETTGGGHWVRFRPEGTTDNRFGYGVRIEARAGSARWLDEVSPVATYLSSSDPVVHLGTGAAAVLDEVTVRWPSGKHQRFTKVQTDREWRIHEEQGLLPAEQAGG
jgi:hypothetical protein